jgi:hypothetical protein
MKRLLILYTLLLAASIAFSGCFDIKRDIKIYPNGSGVEKMYVTIDKEFFSLMQTYAAMDNSGRMRRKLDSLNDNTLFYGGITTDIQRAPGISLRDLVLTNKPDGGKEIYINYTFDDPSAIIRVMNELTYSFSNQLNVIYATLKFFDEGDKLNFKSVVRNASRSFDDSTALSLFSSLISTSRITESIEFPFDIVSSNAQSQADKTLTWDFSMRDAVYNQVEMTAELVREQGIDLPYAEKIDKTIERVSKNKNPMIRVQVYNANKEPVKIGAGVIIGDGLLVTNYALLDVMEGRGYFSVIMQNDSLAGIDEMREKDLVPSLDLVFLRFNNFERTKTIKYASLDVKYGQKLKLLYFPNTLSSIVYSMDATVTGTKKFGKSKVIEVKPNKPVTIQGGALFNEAGEFVGMITAAYSGEVGKLYAIPSMYIKASYK